MYKYSGNTYIALEGNKSGVPAGYWYCDVCKQQVQPPPSWPVSMWEAALKAFDKMHKGCKSGQR